MLKNNKLMDADPNWYFDNECRIYSLGTSTLEYVKLGTKRYKRLEQIELQLAKGSNLSWTDALALTKRADTEKPAWGKKLLHIGVTKGCWGIVDNSGQILQPEFTNISGKLNNLRPTEAQTNQRKFQYSEVKEAKDMANPDYSKTALDVEEMIHEESLPDLMPNPQMIELLKTFYQPCSNFGICPEAQWNPKLGQIPRGFIGCTGELDEVETIMVLAEPGHPNPEKESYEAELTPEEFIQKSMNYGLCSLKNGRTPFYDNVRWFIDQLYPGASVEEWSKKIWKTQSRFCSIDQEIGTVSGPNKSLCAEELLMPQINLLPNATTVLFGGKARKRIGPLIPNSISAYALAPPGANHQPARPSWLRAIEIIECKRNGN
jgi:hypothetical protein